MENWDEDIAPDDLLSASEPPSEKEARAALAHFYTEDELSTVSDAIPESLFSDEPVTPDESLPMEWELAEMVTDDRDTTWIARMYHRIRWQVGHEIDETRISLYRSWERLLQTPERCQKAFAAIAWDRHLSVRKGFLVGVLLGLSVLGSTLWGLTSVAYLPGQAPVEPILQPTNLPIPRFSVPSELAWFFIQYPYVSASASIRQKNRHTFIVSDGPRRRDYVVVVGQQFRRVEIYLAGAGESRDVIIFLPGYKRKVSFQGAKVVAQSMVPDGNLWMWRSPLWNPLHLKIYKLADSWLDSPYKRYSCAGFVHKFLSDAGVRVPILDAWDMARLPWPRIAFDEMEPGDIITIRAGSREHRRMWRHSITHVGVYLGHGKMIHAATGARDRRAWVRINDVSDFGTRVDKVLRPPELL